MFGIGTPELILILIVALIVIGPSKLPEMARALGKAMGEFRRVTNDVKHTIEMEADQAEKKARAEEAKKELFPDGETAIKNEGAESVAAPSTAEKSAPAAEDAKGVKA